MQRKKTISIVLLMLFCLPLCVGQSSKYYQGAQWKSLFNGKDLTGWKNVGREKWTVDDGAVLGESLVGGDGFIVTEEEFTSFERKKGQARSHPPKIVAGQICSMVQPLISCAALSA